MVPIFTIVAGAVSLMLGIYLGILTARSTFPFKATLPHLAVVALIAVLLSAGDNQLIVAAAGALIAGYCTSTWSIILMQRRRGSDTTRSVSSFGAYSADVQNEAYRPSLSELPFQRRGNFDNRTSDWQWISPGARRTSSGTIIELRVNNRNPDTSKDRKAPNLTSVN